MKDLRDLKDFAIQDVQPLSDEQSGRPCERCGVSEAILLAYATVHGRAWYKLLDAPVLTADVTL